MSNYALFQRAFDINIGGSTFDIGGLSVLFDIDLTIGKKPNKAEIKIINLSADTRHQFLQGYAKTPKNKNAEGVLGAYNWPITVRAGYQGNLQQVFAGDITKVNTRKEKVEWITILTAKDGGYQYRSARINKTFGSGTKIADVLKACAASFGLGLGNSAKEFAAAAGSLKLQSSVTVAGKVEAVLDNYLNSLGYRWSIQQGQLQVLALDQKLKETAVVLSPDSGLVGSPEVGEKGIIEGKCLLNGEVKPGRSVNLISSAVTGWFVVKSSSHKGETRGKNWYTDFELKAII